MKKTFYLILALFTLKLFADAVIFSGDDVKALKQNIDLFDVVKIQSGVVNPSSGAGVASPQGSIYLATSGASYLKTGSADTAWTEVATLPVDLTTDVTGVLSVANGGTGSATQNFVDLTTNQTINGAKTFQATTSVRNLTVTNATGDGYILMPGQSVNPTAPSAGNALVHGITNNGFTRLHLDNESTDPIVLSRDSVFIARNTSGSPITKGQVVYVTGSTGAVPNVSLAKADSILTVKSTIGVATETSVANGSYGQFMVTGILDGVNTSSYNSGDPLYVATATDGALINVEPSYPYFTKDIGVVLNQGVGDGSIIININSHTGNTASGTNATTFSANQLVSTVSTGTPPLTVSSTTKVSNLYVDRAALADTVTTNANLTGAVTSVGNAASLGSFSSANLSGALTDETGTGVSVFNTSPTFTTDITTPLIVGGTSTTQSITYKTTTGVGTTGADHVFKVGNNGGTEAMRILNSGYVGIGTPAPSSKLELIENSNGSLGTTLKLANQFLSANSNVAIDFVAGDQDGNATSRILGISGSSGVGGVSGSMSFYTKANGGTGVGLNEAMIITSTGAVGIGTSNPSNSAIVEATSTTRGILTPRMTKTQKDAISSPATGLEVYDTDLSKKSYYANSAWSTLQRENNLLLNGDAEGSSGYGWTCTVGTCTKSTTAGEYSEGTASLKVALSSQAMNVSQSVSTPSGIQKQGAVGVIYRVPSTMTDFQICSMVDGAEQTCTATPTSSSLVLDDTFRSIEIPLIFGSTSAGIKFKTTATATANAFFDGAYLKQGLSLQKLHTDNVYSAKVAGDGTVSGENVDWLSTTDAGPTDTSLFTLTFNTGIFSVAPNCIISQPDVTSSSGWFNANQTTTVTSTTLIVRTSAGDATTNYTNNAKPFTISCQKAGNDYLASSANVYNQVNANTNWTACTFSTLAWQGLGTVTNNLQCRRNNGMLEMRGSFTSGTAAASEARFPLPTNYGTITTGTFSSGTDSYGFLLRVVAGSGNIIHNAIAGSGLGYFRQSAAIAVTSSPDTAVNGNAVWTAGEVGIFNNIRIPIAEWSNSNVIVGSFANTLNVPGITIPTLMSAAVDASEAITSNENSFLASCTNADPSGCTFTTAFSSAPKCWANTTSAGTIASVNSTTTTTATVDRTDATTPFILFCYGAK